MQIRNTICTNYSYGGQYKTDDNVILEIDSQGNKKVRFAPVPAEDSYQELDKRFAVVNSNKITKTSRIESTVLNSLLPISKAEICKLLPDISPTTVEAVLGKMVKSGIITTIGNGRATKYLRK
ncbi:MAG: hypothetical protein IKP51_04390 [Treponema sp.]|nr:hypothetical protein [Treponema sp.]